MIIYRCCNKSEFGCIYVANIMIKDTYNYITICDNSTRFARQCPYKEEMVIKDKD